MNNKMPLFWASSDTWVRTLRAEVRRCARNRSKRGRIPWSGTGGEAPAIDFVDGRATASALLMANMNCLPLDYVARTSVGGVNLSFFIVKQLPVLPPERYAERIVPGVLTAAEAIVTRVLELSYTSRDLVGFARGLGYYGPPFTWEEEDRHRLKCELDAIFARMYGLERAQLEWILEADAPSISFPTLKRNEEKSLGEFRTSRYVLEAFDQLTRGEPPCIRSAQ